MTDVEYEPVAVADVLAEMKDTAELLIDLSYSAVLHGSADVAHEVLALEERMDVLQLRARMALLLAARSPDEAEQLAPVLGVVDAAETISDAAGDIAGVVLGEVGLPADLRAALPDAVETVVRGTVADDSPYAGRTLGDANLETDTGVRVLAVRRGDRWVLDASAETTLEPGDVVLARGPRDHVAGVYADLTGSAYDRPPAPDPSTDDLGRAVDAIVLMKDTSELAVDLAYGAVLFDSAPVAEEVRRLEAEVDSLRDRLEFWTLRAAARVDDPGELRGLVRIAAAAEEVSDAALEIAEGVLRGLDTHPVVAAAVEESDEVIVRLTVAADAPLAGATLGEHDVRGTTGTQVVAVRRADDEWVVSPDGRTQVGAGDVLVAKGTRAGTERLAELAGDARSGG